MLIILDLLCHLKEYNGYLKTDCVGTYSFLYKHVNLFAEDVRAHEAGQSQHLCYGHG